MRRRPVIYRTGHVPDWAATYEEHGTPTASAAASSLTAQIHSVKVEVPHVAQINPHLSTPGVGRRRAVQPAAVVLSLAQRSASQHETVDTSMSAVNNECDEATIEKSERTRTQGQVVIEDARDWHVTASDDSSVHNDDDEMIEADRRRDRLIRLRALEEAKLGNDMPEKRVESVEESRISENESVSQSSPESGSEETSDEDEDSEQDDEVVRLKPVFVVKNGRSTVIRGEDAVAKELEEEKAEMERQKARKAKASEYLVNALVQQSGGGDEDTIVGFTKVSDEERPEEEAAEFVAWKVRELQRLLRDSRERQDRLEVERLRGVGEAEKKSQEADTKKSMKFLQRYYHKGAFYADDDSVVDRRLLERDVTVATGIDAQVDKQVLPSVLQVKSFGKASRTKYTHLTDQDTTQRELNPWAESERAPHRSRRKSSSSPPHR